MQKIAFSQPFHLLLIGNKIIGLYFIDGHLNGNRYANFLEHTLGTLLEDLPLITRYNNVVPERSMPGLFFIGCEK